MESMDLSAALVQFDRALANLERLEDLWKRYEPNIPTSPAFGLDTSEVDQVRRDYSDVAHSLPPIDGYRLDADLPSLDGISQAIIDVWEIDEPSAIVDIHDMSQAPRRQIEEYRHRLVKARRQLVRRRIEDVVSEVDDLLRSTIRVEQGREFCGIEDGWLQLSEMIAELDRLRGADQLRGTRIGDLNRHIRFAEPNDLRDIVELDWPSVRTALIDIVYDGEPLPISVDDLGELVRSEPTGPVTSRLQWSQLDSETFERLLFDLLHSTSSYENVEWLMKTSAPDRGRDISAERVIVDELSGTERRHVLFQCKNWQSRSVNVRDLTTLLEEVKLWSRPFLEVVLVTSGRFSQDAVDWRDKRELSQELPIVRFWAGSHLEALLASRPSVRSKYF